MNSLNIDDARKSVREIASRRREVDAEAARVVLPWWYVSANAAAAWAVVASMDFDDLSIVMMAAGLAFIVVVNGYGPQSQRVAPRALGRSGPARTAIPVAVAALLTVYFSTAIVLRLVDAPFAHSTAGAAMVVTLIALTPWVRRAIRASLLDERA